MNNSEKRKRNNKDKNHIQNTILDLLFKNMKMARRLIIKQ